MSIQFLLESAEYLLLEDLDQAQKENSQMQWLQCRFTLVSVIRPDPEAMTLKLKDIDSFNDGKLYYFQGGDLFFQWPGNHPKTKTDLEAILTSYCTSRGCSNLPDRFFQHYDSHVNADALRTECNAILQQHATHGKDAKENGRDPDEPFVAEFNELQKQALMYASIYRPLRSQYEILIVEDQTFSRKLLASLINRQYHCLQAQNAEEAVSLYANHAPNIVFLDIELPDVNGHTLAELFKATDPDAYIVMVTANKFSQDVERAKANDVEGYIVKPYNKQKIINSINHYAKLVPPVEERN